MKVTMIIVLIWIGHFLIESVIAFMLGYKVGYEHGSRLSLISEIGK